MPAYSTSNDFSTPKVDLDPSYNPFSSSKKKNTSYHSEVPSANRDWERLYENFAKSKMNNSDDDGPADELEPESQQEIMASALFSDNEHQNESLDNEPSKNLQINGSYIASSINSGMMIVDQHRAHIRILYDKYLAQIKFSNIQSQRIMFPEVIQFTPSQSALLAEVEEVLTSMGFNLSKLSGNDWAINGVPSGLENCNVKDTILNVIESVSEMGSTGVSSLNEKIAFSLSKSGAIPYGRTLSESEIDALLSDLLKSPEANYTPDGKKIICHMNSEQLGKLF